MARKTRRFTDQHPGDTTIIAAGIRFKGDFSGEGHIYVAGSVECNCELTGAVTVAKAGNWVGRLVAENVVIAGTVRGDIECTGNVELTPNAVIHGDITAKTIAIAEGATIDGHMNTSTETDIIHFKEKREATAVTPETS